MALALALAAAMTLALVLVDTDVCTSVVAFVVVVVVVVVVVATLATAPSLVFFCSNLAYIAFAFARVARTIMRQPPSVHAFQIGSTTP